MTDERRTGDAPRPAWREPMTWLVWGLPAAAVIASFISLGLAIHARDTLVDQGLRRDGLVYTAGDTHPDAPRPPPARRPPDRR